MMHRLRFSARALLLAVLRGAAQTQPAAEIKVLAHELAHVLMDSGEHVEDKGNLMREVTAPDNTRLSAAQCAQLRETAEKNAVLRKAPG